MAGSNFPKVSDRRDEFWLSESADQSVYLFSLLYSFIMSPFEEILRIGSSDYLPTDSDILWTRKHVTGHQDSSCL
jgi:hypothetical protein